MGEHHINPIILKRQRMWKTGICYWCCGPATTREHCPPAGMFPTMKGSNKLPQFPACDECNNRFSASDDPVIQVFYGLTSKGDSDAYNQAMKVLRGPEYTEIPGFKMMRANGKLLEGNNTLREKFRSLSFATEVKTEGGIYLQNTGGITMDEEFSTIILCFAERLARSQWLLHTGRYLVNMYGNVINGQDTFVAGRPAIEQANELMANPDAHTHPIKNGCWITSLISEEELNGKVLFKYNGHVLLISFSGHPEDFEHTKVKYAIAV